MKSILWFATINHQDRRGRHPEMSWSRQILLSSQGPLIPCDLLQNAIILRLKSEMPMNAAQPCVWHKQTFDRASLQRFAPRQWKPPSFPEFQWDQSNLKSAYLYSLYSAYRWAATLYVSFVFLLRRIWEQVAWNRPEDGMFWDLITVSVPHASCLGCVNLCLAAVFSFKGISAFSKFERIEDRICCRESTQKGKYNFDSQTKCKTKQ